MYWNRETKKLSISSTDIAVLSQCRVPVDRLLLSCSDGELPPMDSVLQYALLQDDYSSPDAFWVNYRQLQRMYKNVNNYYLPMKITKRDGTYRYLYKPFLSLRMEQTFILRNILEHLPVDSHAYGYRRGVRLSDCAKPHVGKDILIHMDIQDFFGSITRRAVYETLQRETGYSKSLCRFLTTLCCYCGKLPQGAVTSPALSNIVFAPCDAHIAKLASLYGITYTRYSDDLYFSGDSSLDDPIAVHPTLERYAKENSIRLPNAPKRLDTFMLQVTMLLSSYGFKVNHKKTKVRRQQNRQCVLGITVNEKAQVTRSYRRKLLQEVYYLNRFGKFSKGVQEDGDYLHYIQTLEGKVAFVLSVRPNDPAFLKAKALLAQKHLLWEMDFI